jgi:AP2 domain
MPLVKRHEPIQPQDQSIRYIPLTQGFHAIVDADQYEHLMQWRWNAHWNPLSKSYYAVRNRRLPDSVRRYTAHYMHNEVMRVMRGIDHIRCEDTLDNRRSNLRPANASQQAVNRALTITNKSGYKGVFQRKCTGRYRARSCKDGKTYSGGEYPTAIKAAHAYDRLARRLHGEFAWLNFPQH